MEMDCREMKIQWERYAMQRNEHFCWEIEWNASLFLTKVYPRVKSLS